MAAFSLPQIFSLSSINRGGSHHRHHGRKVDEASYLSCKGTIGQTSPNPNVGAVIVKNGELLGVGSHLHAGKKHAEVYALEQAAKQALGTTLYVTLEPCNHYGKTPPYTEKILSAGIQRVVIGSIDPDPRVAGSGIQRLQKHGIEVTTGVLQ